MAYKIFERLAEETWERLRLSHIYGVRAGEEGITDNLLLQIMISLNNSGAYETYILMKGKTSKHLEKVYGTDWEWWIGNDKKGWIRYAIQAKVIDVQTSRYPALAHKVNGRMQIDILEEYSRINGAIPIYCFYNNAEHYRNKQYWQCCKSINFEQLGCSISPSYIARQAINKRGGKTFGFIHSKSVSYPWRCLVLCEQFHNPKTNPLRVPNRGIDFYYDEPPRFMARRTVPVTEDQIEIRRWPNNEFQPRKIMITELKELG